MHYIVDSAIDMWFEILKALNQIFPIKWSGAATPTFAFGIINVVQRIMK